MPAEADCLALANEEMGIRWQRLEACVARHFSFLAGLNVIEIGAGAGTNAALMARRGAEVTILDFASKALDRAREFFERNGLRAKFIQADALSLPAELPGQFDITMSFGLAEHFKGPDRVHIIQSHFDLLKPKGLTFISVPNRYNPPYRVYKFVAQKLGPEIWKVGEEYPFSRRELARICRECGGREFGFFGDSFFSSFRFLNPVQAVRKLLKRKRRQVSQERKETGTFLDSYFSYALVLYAKK